MGLTFPDGSVERVRLGPEAVPEGLGPGDRVLVTGGCQRGGLTPPPLERCASKPKTLFRRSCARRDSNPQPSDP